jgi:uncharacterized membrane protein
MTTDKNRFVAEQLGVVPYISPGGYKRNDVPDFTSDAGAVQLLRLIMNRDDYGVFLRDILKCPKVRESNVIFEAIWIDDITTPGKLLQAVWEWSKEHPNK